MEAKNQTLTKRLREARRARATDDAAPDAVNGNQDQDMAQASDDDDHHGSDIAKNNEVANQVVSLSLNAGGQRQYLGSASGAILANLLGLQGQAGQAGVDSDAEPLFRRFTTTRGQINGVLEPVQDIPHEQLARSLLAAYLSHDHLCYPYLHPGKLINTVAAMYSEEHYYETHNAEAFTMDMIFAIATAQVHKFSWQVLPDAETHYERAMSKLGRVLETGGLVSLQSIMLLCQYRMLSVSYSTSASLWHLLGMAARLGLELGLHREAVYTIPEGISASAREELREEVEIKRRCFWSLFGMDRVVSNTLGRPMAINLDDIDTEYPLVEEDRGAISTASPSVEDILDNPEWPANTAVFVHITWHRVITGKILSSLHNPPKSRMPDAQTCANIREQLKQELDQWKSGVASLQLVDPNTGKVKDKSTFKSPEWYRLLYSNCILMLHRPTNSPHDHPLTTAALEQVYHCAQESIQSYCFLYKERRINYTWITLHAVFIVGLSYIYALRTHFQNKRRQFRALAEGQPATTEGQLSVDPTITQIVADTRACSTVLVALSERWNTARECHEVFGRLSDAVLADSSDFYISSTSNQRANSQNAPTDSSFKPNEPLLFDDFSTEQLSAPQIPTEVDNTYQDCYEELQELFGSYYGDNALLRPPFDWNFEL
ncbi:hypothetical protein CDV31_005151 [Fusarium ambrosium]|uniref:Xylanolytic transcriptional activator regulatory domain-containing protein n=1 Tax=Fusarium ambrosium TaxID=131363 RepID=A0A428UL78_9HYPO|nr:hypothetical protein CDV31_005151 [Fusarium ambrosium]